MIGLIVHEIDDPFFTEIAGGIVRSASEENPAVQVSSHRDGTQSRSPGRSPHLSSRTWTPSSLPDRGLRRSAREARA